MMSPRETGLAGHLHARRQPSITMILSFRAFGVALHEGPLRAQESLRTNFPSAIEAAQDGPGRSRNFNQPSDFSLRGVVGCPRSGRTGMCWRLMQPGEMKRGGKARMKSKRALMVVVSVALIVGWNVYTMPEAAADHCSRGEGTLSGPAINGRVPSGKVVWQGNSFCQPLQMQVEVNNVNLPDGTVLTVDACARGTPSNVVGSIRLSGGGGKLMLSKLDGNTSNDNVPFCDMRFGDAVKVLRSGTIIVSGCVSNPDIPGAPEC